MEPAREQVGTAARTTPSHDLDFTEAVAEGKLTITVRVEVDEAGGTVTADGRINSRLLDGTDLGCGALVSTETRRTIDAMWAEEGAA